MRAPTRLRLVCFAVSMAAVRENACSQHPGIWRNPFCKEVLMSPLVLQKVWSRERRRLENTLPRELVKQMGRKLEESDGSPFL